MNNSHGHQEGVRLHRDRLALRKALTIYFLTNFYLFSNCITTNQYLKPLKITSLGEAKNNALNNTLYCKQKTWISLRHSFYTTFVANKWIIIMPNASCLNSNLLSPWRSHLILLFKLAYQVIPSYNLVYFIRCILNLFFQW